MNLNLFISSLLTCCLLLFTTNKNQFVTSTRTYTTSIPPLANEESKEPLYHDTTRTSSSPGASQLNAAAAAPASGSLWFTEDEPNLRGNEKLLKYISRVGVNMRASTDNRDYRDVELDETLLAWRLMHEKVEKFARDEVSWFKPKIRELLRDTNASAECVESVELTLNSLENLDSWAVQMWNSMGSFPPVGLLGGQFTDLGSYKNCINLVKPNRDNQTTGSSERRFINSRLTSTTVTPSSNNHYAASYCTLSFRPIVSSRPHFHMIFHEIDKKLAQQFNESDVFNTLAHKAHYFYYVYMKTGLCVPAECSPRDLQRVAAKISRRLVLSAGPVKCYTRSGVLSEFGYNQQEEEQEQEASSNKKLDNEPLLIDLSEPLNSKQFVAALVVSSFFGLVFIVTLWHLIELYWKSLHAQTHNDQELGLDQDEKELEQQQQLRSGQVVQVEGCKKLVALDGSAITEECVGAKEACSFKHLAFENLSLITNGKEFLDSSMKNNEIKCLHGLRVLTMVWIICVHTMQYNEWAGFTYVFEVVPTLQNIVLHPLYNANYVVDNFFFMSGLLASYTAWYSHSGTSLNYSFKASLIGRYLRLTPQVLLISLLNILLPRMGNSPNWYDMSHEAGKNCEKNWWVNLLHIQSFYREDEMCNLVGWWISVDVVYYILATGLIFLILKRTTTKKALVLTGLLVGFCMSVTAYRHYLGAFPPNNLGVIPQIDEVWTQYVVRFFWSPYPHAFPFFYGLWIGYALANNKWRLQVRKWSRFGWTSSILVLMLVNLSSHIWMAGYVEVGPQYISTAYNIVCVILWSAAFSWIVIACHYGCGQILNTFLANEMFVILSKASFIIYLSHMLIVRMYFGLQNTLLDVSVSTIGYAIVGNVFLSGVLGVFLTISFETPFMKLQRRVVKKLKNSNGTSIKIPKEARYLKTTSNINYPNTGESKIILQMSPTRSVLLK